MSPLFAMLVYIMGIQTDWVFLKRCVMESKQDEWYWMQYLDMTSHVHQLVAEDMAKVVANHF